ncbi:MAG: hypothetical protein B7X35_08700 [Halothiobacillus sp. 14-56-357]|nr:MAG: hypothetical protein B7X44_05420 [Halothiobacillus sp. 15-55-196]OZB55602.1 MAG: hypothetical protein B7X35_08700 [Halothiobacillus sp. 14-56-357]OZB77826.1 MAG: hypothetical protein B7X29_07200 [Halothiobacillus sp. 13-55-115]
MHHVFQNFRTLTVPFSAHEDQRATTESSHPETLVTTMPGRIEWIVYDLNGTFENLMARVKLQTI